VSVEPIDRESPVGQRGERDVELARDRTLVVLDEHAADPAHEARADREFRALPLESSLAV
jgi:hypothetical protein